MSTGFTLLNADALSALEIDLEGSDAAPTEPQRQVLAASDERLERALKLWGGIHASALNTLNKALGKTGIGPIAIPPVDQIPPAEGSPGKDLP